jgi:hypothetical protein
VVGRIIQELDRFADPVGKLHYAVGCAGCQHYTGGVLCNADQSPEYVAKIGQCGKYESAPVDALSGLGSQAGGPDYLRHFLIPRTITENTLRRGFAPVEDP